MRISQKCHYAVRALLELARHHGGDPVRIADIAESQDIPERFLEVILSELKRGGFVASRRGRNGGYLMDVAPRRLSVGQVIRFVDGPLSPVEGLDETGEEQGFFGRHALTRMWRQAREALSGVYDETSFADLIEREEKLRDRFVPRYAI